MKTFVRHNSIRIIFIACYIQFLLGQTNNWRSNLLPSSISGHLPGRPAGDRPLPTALSGPEDRDLLWSDPAEAPFPRAAGFHNPGAPTVHGPNHNHDHAGSLLNHNPDLLLETSVSAIRDRHVPPTDVVFPSSQFANDSVGIENDRRRRDRRRQRRNQRRQQSNFLDTARKVNPSNVNPPTPSPEPIPGTGRNGNNGNRRRNNRLHSPNFPVPPNFVTLSIAEQILLLDRVEFLEEENARLEALLAKQKILLDERKRIVEAAESTKLATEKEKKRLAAEKEAARILAENEKKRIAAELAKQKQIAEKERKRLIAEAEATKIRAEEERARLEKEAKIAEEKRLAAIAEAKRLAELAKRATPSPPVVIHRRRRRRRLMRRIGRLFG